MMIQPVFKVLLFAIFLCWSSGIASAEYSGALEEWSAYWQGFEDDFSDGVFPDGGAGEQRLYEVTCGSVDDASESGGLLDLDGPDPSCNGYEVQSTLSLTSEGIVSVTYAFQIPKAGESYGFGIWSDSLDRVVLLMQRGNLPGVGADVLYIALYADPGLTVVSRTQLADLPDSDPNFNNKEAVEFQIELVRDSGTLQMIPTARYRLCSSSPCDQQGPSLVALNPLASAPADAGALDLGIAHYPVFLGFGASAFTRQLEEWQIVADSADDFETDPFPSAAVYTTSTGICGMVDQFAGDLELSSDESSCPEVRANFAEGIPGAAGVQGAFEWQIPELCGRYGIGLTSDTPTDDRARLFVERDRDGSLVVVLESESEPGANVSQPTIERATISSDPVSDAALASIVLVELRVEASGSPLIPHGQYRLCETNPCATEVVLPFSDLSAAPFSGGPEDGCKSGEVRDVSLDGGALSSLDPILAQVFIVPEIEDSVASATVLLLLAVVSAQRRRRGWCEFGGVRHS